MFSVRRKGNFSRTKSRLSRSLHKIDISKLNEFGRNGVAALSSATPKDTGKTASSWYYEIEKNSWGYRITYCNDNIENGVPIAVLIQYGHGTRSGAYVEGFDYINPALKPVFENAFNYVSKED